MSVGALALEFAKPCRYLSLEERSLDSLHSPRLTMLIGKKPIQSPRRAVAAGDGHLASESHLRASGVATLISS